MDNKTNNEAVNFVTFSPNGKYVASGSHGGTASIWEVTTGNEVARFVHDSSVDVVAFNPVGNYIFSGGFDGVSYVWPWQSTDLISDACKSLRRNLTRAEWEKYIGNAVPYQAVCPNLPIEAEPTPTATP